MKKVIMGATIVSVALIVGLGLAIIVCGASAPDWYYLVLLFATAVSGSLFSLYSSWDRLQGTE